MNRIQVRTKSGPCDALVGSELLRQAGDFVRRVLPRGRCVVVSDSNVAPLYGELVLESLRDAGCAPELTTIAAGESSKSFSEAGRLCEQLSTMGLDRSSFLVSLGGGVVGDLTGFVASIFLRGIPYVALPTTLLAQVDSCLGGKTGVNTSSGKNLIGTFHRPALIIADTATLRSLPERVWNEGFAEAIKHGVIRDRALFEAAVAVERDDPAGFIARNLEIKAALVAEDERDEKGIRALLNFGHTVGHAIEHAAGYGQFLHGEALSLGMVAAARVSVRRAGLSLGECERIIETLRARQLPVELPPDFSHEKILAALGRDKKFVHGRIRFVVAHAIGRVSVSEEVTEEDIRAALS